jgi:tRNA (cmo5U34)-methyltransferase
MKLGDEIDGERSSWSFGGDVPGNFVKHAERSIPGYREGHQLVCHLSDFFMHDDSVCYELGTSTGELLRKLAEHNSHKPGCRWVGIDSVEEMVETARDYCAEIGNIEICCDDALKFPYDKADLFVSYYAVQFMPPRFRQDLFDLVYASLNWSGAFVLFEKVRGPDARFQDILTSLYVDFKKRKGFTADEILNKSDSLRGVLEPFSTQGNLDLLARAGFTDVTSIYKNMCFEGFLAIK